MEFNRRRAAADVVERKDKAWLAGIAVGGGFAQLLLIHWADGAFVHGTAVRIEGAVFLVYIAAVIGLIARVERPKRASAMTCPGCGVVLSGDHLRIAGATGRCDSCGKQIISDDNVNPDDASPQTEAGGRRTPMLR